jgi:hypothetical protein
MRITGWTVPELRAAPARVIRAHFARIFAGLAWSPELAEAAAAPMPPREAYRDIGEWGKARAAKGRAAEMLATVKAALWPEDD